MTDQHPLTDDTCRQLANIRGRLGLAEIDFMRAAADWQLEQVIKWLKDNMPKYVYQDYYGADEQQEVFKTLENLKLAMRPTTQDDN